MTKLIVNLIVVMEIKLQTSRRIFAIIFFLTIKKDYFFTEELFPTVGVMLDQKVESLF